MASVSPATIGPQLAEEVDTWISQSQGYRSRDELDHRRYWKKAEGLARVDPGRMYAIKMVLTAATGAYDEAMAMLGSLKCHDEKQALATQTTVAILCGHYTDSLSTYRTIIDPDFGEFQFLMQGVPNGAFETYVRALDKGRKAMNLTLTPHIEKDIRSVVDILRANGDSEDQVVAALDIAGEVLREHRMFQYHIHPRIRPVPDPSDGQAPYFGYDMFVNTDPATAFDMTLEYVEKLATSNLRIPASMVFSFVAE